MKLLSTLTKTLFLTLALASCSPAFAQEECITPNQADEIIRGQVPDAEIVSTNPDDFTITYSAPSKPTNLELHFDEKGCLVTVNEVA